MDPGKDAGKAAISEIRAQLNDAKALGRWSVTGLAKRSGLGRTTVSNALNGGPISAETLACLAGPLRLDPDELLSRLRDASPTDAAPWIDSRTIVRTVSQPNDQNALPVGRPISRLDPLDLEVHRAIEVPGAGSSIWPQLPEYVPREHDRQLALAVAKSTAGTSQLAMLVGPSSTGKTRACWEAIQSLPDNWRLWHPIDPDRPEAALRDLKAVGPHTVVWLNEAQHYLLAPVHGASIAAGLRTLLSDSSRAPVLVLGTIWPAYHEELMHVPGRREPDPHSQARHLLAGRDVPVPTCFDPSTVASLMKGSDPRLVNAAKHAEDGMITQYLAGAPELLARYRRSSPGPRALIEAAMDARRLGYPTSLPLPFLATAAEGYFTDTEWDLLPENWLEQALSFLTTPVRGARGALTPIKRPRGYTSSDVNVPSYRLADYLEQLGRATRHMGPPKEFWQAAIQNCHGDRAEALAIAASRRGLMQISALLAAQSNKPSLLLSIANELAHAGRLDEAIPWYKRLIGKGETYLIPFVAQRLRKAHKHREAQEWIRHFGMPRRTQDLVNIADRLARKGRLDKSLPLYRRAAEHGRPFALRLAANRLVSAGRLDESLNWYERCGDDISLHIAAYRLAQAGRLQESLAWFQKSAEAGNKRALRSAAAELTAAGRLTEALTWYERAAAANPKGALRDAADALARADQLDEALHWYRRASEAGDQSALRLAGDRLMACDRKEEAAHWYAQAYEAGDSSAASRFIDANQPEVTLKWYESAAAENKLSPLTAARQLESRGLLNEALDWYMRAAAEGIGHAPCEIARLLSNQGKTNEAVKWYEVAAGAGQTHALTSAGYCLSAANRLNEALGFFERAYNEGETAALYLAANQLSFTGRLDEAVVWYERAANNGFTEALCAAAVRLTNAGRLDEALPWFERASNLGHTHKLVLAAHELLMQGRIKEAISWYHRAAASGSRGATYAAVVGLRQAGFLRESISLLMYGWTVDGQISAPWTADAICSEDH